MNITPAITKTLGLGKAHKSAQYFLDLAEDAGNWGGMPWLDGNVAAGKGASAMSQTLVKAGLIKVEDSGEGAFAIFTPEGIEAAGKVGIDLEWLLPKEASDEETVAWAQNLVAEVKAPATEVKICKNDPSHGPHRVTKTGSYCYTCDRIVGDAQTAAARAMRADKEVGTVLGTGKIVSIRSTKVDVRLASGQVTQVKVTDLDFGA